ncbi:helix-turn-helix transcriptional regulator [Nocardia sp. NPDC024068]|uniref:helix-turn-helix domain-containing protein n=1 Tax=Nocardia sp. NPDC024068 TaxID=3157197 RepID=UPI0033E7ABB9
MAMGSTLPRRALGQQLRKLRERNEISQAQASRIAETSPQSYGRLEDGRITKVTDMALNALANAYRATDEERRLLLDLAREIRVSPASGSGWWRAYSDAIAQGFDHYLALEEAANHVTSWQTAVVPGLLQTREYRRALTWAMLPNGSQDEVERQLALFAERRNALRSENFRFEALLSEAVVRQQVGSPSVIAEQLKHLIEQSEKPEVEVRILPFRETRPVGLVASFVLFEFPPLASSGLLAPPAVHIEGLVGELYIERESEVSEYMRQAAMIRRVALSESASREWMVKTLKETAHDGVI